MALNKQIHIYSLDTGAFYFPGEELIHKRMLRYVKYKNILKGFDTNGYSKDKKKHFRKINQKINKEISESKKLLKQAFHENKKIRKLEEDKISDKKMISVFESTLTRTIGINIDELTTDIMVVQTFFYEVIEQIIKNGFIYNGEKYKYLTSSAGQIRTKKTVFIKESIWNKYESSLMCGLSVNKINSHGGINVNKFLAYLALFNSATDLWDDFDIDRCIVVKDMETFVEGEVDYIDDTTYSIIRKLMKVPITHTDGSGMILPILSKKNFMVRLPWFKGLLASFDFVKFIIEHNCSPIIKDIYGKEWNIIEDNIQIIFTESQFKMHKYFSCWQEYKDNFKSEKCQAGICNLEEDYFSNATINYQMVQSLTDITEPEIDILLKRSKETLFNMARDKDTMLRVFGATKSNERKNSLQESLMIYPELLQDEYCRHTLRQIKNSLVKDFKSAKLEIDAKYTFLIPDMYAFCEYLFQGNENPKGLLKDGEVFCKLFKGVKKIDCLRSPHLYREHAIRNNVVDVAKSKWFKTDAIYTSCHDLISKILQFDVDGDKSLVVADKTFVEIAERNMNNDNIVPLYYDMKKAKSVELNSDSIYAGINAAYTGGNIGVYSNNISKIWNGVDWKNVSTEEKFKALEIIKLLCMENNFVIDYAKTLYKPDRPEEINTQINEYIKCKVPHFFIYAKDKLDTQVEASGLSIIDSFDKKIINTPLKFDLKNYGKFNYRNLMKNKFIQVDLEFIELFDKLNQTYHYKIDQKNKENVAAVINIVKSELLQYGYSESDTTDILVKHLFSNRKTHNKKLLWECFGETMLNNIKKNIPKGSILCETCHQRFLPLKRETVCCDCQKIEDRKKRIRLKVCVDCGCGFEADPASRNIRCEKCRADERKRINREKYLRRKITTSS